jgi:AcrR family transcriptional regulator
MDGEMADKAKKSITPVEPKRGYHHGDLRAAMIDAARDELVEHGVEGFTLRGCARRAGVSHAAPAHHFGGVTGLLTAVAVRAYGKLIASMQREVATTEEGSAEHLIAVALGYVRFATDNPDEFKLMFRRERLDPDDPELVEAGQRAFGEPVRAVGAFHNVADPMADPITARAVVRLWSLAHGFSGLLLAGQLGPLSRALAVARAILPDMVREAFGITPADRPQDLAIIARAAATAGRDPG